jgi:F0F1-type ATP synthase assembly protein I
VQSVTICLKLLAGGALSIMAKDDDSGLGQAAGYGLYMAVGVGLGCLIGHWLDTKYGWGNKGLITGAMIGLAAGLYQLIKDAIRLNKD